MNEMLDKLYSLGRIIKEYGKELDGWVGTMGTDFYNKKKEQKQKN